jgi:hypothetical protein
MSESRRTNRSRSISKTMKLQRYIARVRFVHVISAVVRFASFVPPAVLTGACVLPPSLSVDEGDAAVNSPPVIRDVRDEAGNPFERPGPRTLVVGEGRLVITASDADLNDTLYVRYYLDYGLVAPTAAKITCRAAPGAMPTLQRQITCSLVGVCTAVDVGAEHILEIDLYDREPQDDGKRLFRDVAAPGEYTTWWWKVSCLETAS